jgi:hypothetical protein
MSYSASGNSLSRLPYGAPLTPKTAHFTEFSIKWAFFGVNGAA